MTIETNGAITPEDAVVMPPASCRSAQRVREFEEPRKEVAQEIIPDLAFNRRSQEGRRTRTVGAFGNLGRTTTSSTS
jgi:hypothetical protein